MVKKLVFVYGTLMRGRKAHGLLEAHGARFLGEAGLDGYALYDLGAFPGIVPEDGAVVRGEAYLLSLQGLADADRYEGEGSLFSRVKEDIQITGGVRVPADVYVYRHSVAGMKKLPAGQWTRGKE